MIAGQPSVNPLGRPKGAAGIARYISEQTGDGRELVDRLLDLSRSDGPVRERVGATLALLDRLAGRPMQPSEVALAVSQTEPALLPAGFHALPAERRLEVLDELRARALGQGSQS